MRRFLRCVQTTSQEVAVLPPRQAREENFNLPANLRLKDRTMNTDINALRRRLGWSPSDLADFLGTRLTRVNDLVMGMASPTAADRELLDMFAAAVSYDPKIGKASLNVLRNRSRGMGRGAALAVLRASANAAV